MTSQNIKALLDACYQGKRVRELLPPLPHGVRPSYVQYLDVIETLESCGIRVKVSDISDTLHLPAGRHPHGQGDAGQGLSAQNCIGGGWPRDLSCYYRQRQAAFPNPQCTIFCTACAAAGRYSG